MLSKFFPEHQGFGALRLQYEVGPNMARAFVLSSSLLMIVLASIWANGYFSPEEKNGPIRITTPSRIVPFPNLRPHTPQPAPKPREVAPKAKQAKPVPVPVEPDPQPKVTEVPKTDFGSGETSTTEGEGESEPGVGEGDIAGHVEEIPPPELFIPVEVFPQAIASCCKAPEYPELARMAGVSAKVVARVFVDPTGAVRKWDILQVNPAKLGFEDEVIKVLPTWCFKPALQQGRAVGVWVSIPFNFRPL